MTCTADACKICTGCYHGRHGQCSRDLTCPATGEVNACRCCGDYRADAIFEAAVLAADSGEEI